MRSSPVRVLAALTVIWIACVARSWQSPEHRIAALLELAVAKEDLISSGTWQLAQRTIEQHDQRRWQHRGAAPAKGKEYPALASKKLRDRAPKAQAQLPRIGESKWRPLELCFWPDQGALPAKGKEYQGLGYKWLRDRPPKAQQQQPAEAQ
ncbi:hypothetical protein QJQ45_000902 [Haematococcus lacustris]|nr:hypothetical protein QJQ45_000902 [Haematococcus lacustris]